MKLKVVNSQGQETGKEVSLSKDVFGIEPNDHAIYLDVKQYLANQRQGTHKTKEKGEVTASTKKLKRQKGTGTARAGSAKSGVMIGGGRFHGPRPRSYGFKLNRKLKEIARKSALSYKAKDNKISVVDAIAMESPSTKSFVSMLAGLDMSNTRSLMITAGTDSNVYLSARNIPNTEVLSVDNLNTYSILKAANVIFTEEAIKQLETNFKGN
ncbi:MAG: 50S ribosomal protein L4 [Flavobacteriales bacterium]|nr:50S ribosomal protein L4 [Bacteroidota bacterium]MCB9241145.1 50S ribosomal protein L4 [Flavobacteriales bacterium]